MGGIILFTQVFLKVLKRKFRSMPVLFLVSFHFPGGRRRAVACEVRSWGFSPAEMERCSGFRMGFLDDDEWGGGLVVVAVVKDLEMRIVGNRKNRSVGVVVVVVLSSILRVLLFFPAGYEKRRTTNDLCLPACLSMIILRKKLILNKSKFTQDNLLGRDGVK